MSIAIKRDRLTERIVSKLIECSERRAAVEELKDIRLVKSDRTTTKVN